jgi:hypothetical protein
MQKIDYSTLSSQGADAHQASDKAWWACDKSERHQAVAKIVKALSQYDSKRETQYQISTRLYGNTNIMGLNGLSYAKITSVQNALKDRITYNVVQSAIDTVTAKIAKNKPRPLFLTNGGDYKVQRKAKKLNKFIDGLFYENSAYDLGTLVFRDAAVFGDGFIHVFEHYGRVAFERVLPSEMYVDWVESFYGKPRQLHRVKNVDRQVLMQLFPEKREAIMACSGASADLVGTYQNVADQITVVESWHLPSGPDATDGLHTINITTTNLFEEEYTKDFFPFAKMPWCPRMYGWWGQGAAEQLQNIQLEINKILWIIQRSMHLSGTFKVLIENGSSIVTEKLNNDIGSIIHYNGTKPEYVVPPIVPAEFYSQFERLKQLAYEQVGVSQLSAASQKPAGLNSGKALREYNDIESDRFNTIGKAYEKLFLDLARIAIDKAKEIYAREGGYEVRVPGKKFIESIDWKQIDLDEDDYVMQMFPVSSLPNTPEGRLQTVQEYMQAGIISPRSGRRLLDFPDLDQIEDLANSQEDYLHEILEKIVDDGIFTPPDPFDDLKLAQELSLEYYTRAKLQGVEEEKLELLRRFNDQVLVLIQKAMPPPPPMGMGGEPMAAPAAPPVSDLLPNIPGAIA